MSVRTGPPSAETARVSNSGSPSRRSPKTAIGTDASNSGMPSNSITATVRKLMA
ncbi:hypothetical protein [Streptosporangium longisporum]|uniref:hypothetical protein n=1 Tax=Streptosporangium longisporum TaxID=46187 RepID=UPI0031EA0DE7